MSISTIIIGGNPVTLVDFPAKPGLKLIEWNYWDQVASVPSIFTGQKQRHKWPGADMLSGTATMPPLTVAQADDWECFEMQLRGIANAFQMGDPLRRAPRGSGAAFPSSPMVDDTVGNLNIAGSETLNTKGWVANAQGVLRRGDWMQIGYRMYRALDDVNADGSGNASIPIWPTLREQPTNDGTSASWVNATGALTKFRSVTLGGYTMETIWSGFTLPLHGLPADAVIQGIYPVLIASGNFDICFQDLFYGDPAATGGSPPAGGPFTSPYSTHPILPGASFGSTQFYGPTIGTSLSLLANQLVTISLTSSLFNTTITDTMNATGVGYAIYYTSATPITDPLMPPPFTVPSGQGLAWSVPLLSTSVADGGQGNTGTAGGTPAIDNGNIILINPRGLFCLASNKRTSSADPGRLSRTSFPFEEYR